jgi:glucose dehydrogenase
MTLDEPRGMPHIPTGSPTYDYYGADRPGTNLYANCLLALDAAAKGYGITRWSITICGITMPRPPRNW